MFVERNQCLTDVAQIINYGTTKTTDLVFTSFVGGYFCVLYSRHLETIYLEDSTAPYHWHLAAYIYIYIGI